MTELGRIVAMATMVLGVVVFGVITALLAKRFIGQSPEEVNGLRRRPRRPS